MFDLLAFGRERGRLGGGAASLLFHAVVIAGAALATLQPRPVTVPAHVPVRITYVPPAGPGAPPAPAPSVASLAPPVLQALRLTIPASVPAVIPPPARGPFDPSLWVGAPERPAPATTGPAGPTPGDVYALERVQEAPEMLAHPPARYPELLRQAGIEGRVVVEAVIDTAGRVEPGSVRVIGSSNPLFDGPARDVVAASRFRPGRANGRAVRVKVTVPVAFQVAPRSPMM